MYSSSPLGRLSGLRPPVIGLKTRLHQAEGPGRGGLRERSQMTDIGGSDVADGSADLVAVREQLANAVPGNVAGDSGDQYPAVSHNPHHGLIRDKGQARRGFSRWPRQGPRRSAHSRADNFAAAADSAAGAAATGRAA